MRSAACFQIGKIVRKYSYKGEVILLVEQDYIELINKTEPMYIAMSGTLVPFFIEKFNWQKNQQLRIKFEDINSEADAETLIHKKVFLPNELLPQKNGTDFYKDEITGFEVNDVNEGIIGTVKGVNDRRPQLLLEVVNENGMVFIPVTDAFILEIDRKKQRIDVKTPEGLLDLRS